MNSIRKPGAVGTSSYPDPLTRAAEFRGGYMEYQRPDLTPLQLQLFGEAEPICVEPTIGRPPSPQCPSAKDRVVGKPMARSSMAHRWRPASPVPGWR
jgi:hypothetical protein